MPLSKLWAPGDSCSHLSSGSYSLRPQLQPALPSSHTSVLGDAPDQDTRPPVGGISALTVPQGEQRLRLQNTENLENLLAQFAVEELEVAQAGTVQVQGVQEVRVPRWPGLG